MHTFFHAGGQAGRHPHPLSRTQNEAFWSNNRQNRRSYDTPHTHNTHIYSKVFVQKLQSNMDFKDDQGDGTMLENPLTPNNDRSQMGPVAVKRLGVHLVEAVRHSMNWQGLQSSTYLVPFAIQFFA